MSPVRKRASASPSFRRSPARTLSLIGTRRGSSVWNECETGIAIDDTAGSDGSLHSREVGSVLIWTLQSLGVVGVVINGAWGTTLGGRNELGAEMTCSPIGAKIPRQCTIENCASLQRRTHFRPANFSPLFDNIWPRSAHPQVHAKQQNSMLSPIF